MSDVVREGVFVNCGVVWSLLSRELGNLELFVSLRTFLMQSKVQHASSSCNRKAKTKPHFDSSSPQLTMSVQSTDSEYKWTTLLESI